MLGIGNILVCHKSIKGDVSVGKIYEIIDTRNKGWHDNVLYDVAILNDKGRKHWFGTSKHNDNWSNWFYSEQEIIERKIIDIIKN